jgi:histidinol-phosphate aminotransferase
MPLPADILRPHLSAVTYTPVKPLDVLALEIGISEAQLIKLDANENLYGPLPSVRAAMDGGDMHIYPDPSQAAAAQVEAGLVPATRLQPTFTRSRSRLGRGLHLCL